MPRLGHSPQPRCQRHGSTDFIFIRRNLLSRIGYGCLFAVRFSMDCDQVSVAVALPLDHSRPSGVDCLGNFHSSRYRPLQLRQWILANIQPLCRKRYLPWIADPDISHIHDNLRQLGLLLEVAISTPSSDLPFLWITP